MTFVIAKVVVVSAVANGGTLTFGYPSVAASGLRTDNSVFQPNQRVESAVVQPFIQTGPGDFKGDGDHRAFSDGNQAVMVNAVDFTLTFNVEASGVTFTYQGASVIPVGSTVTLQLDFLGQNDGAVFKDDSRVARGALAPIFAFRLGAPVALSTTGVLAATAVADALLHTLTTPIVLDVPRGLQIVSSGADTAVITVRGLDEFLQPLTENFTTNGTTPVLGKKAFKQVISYQASVAMANNLSIGTTNVFGLPALLPVAGYMISDLLNNVKNANAGTVVAGISGAVATATTGDVRGTYTPVTTLPNGTNTYELLIVSPDPKRLGLAQFAG